MAGASTRMIFQENIRKAQTVILCVCISSAGRCERGINSVFTCCLKHISDRENRSNDFNDFFSSASLFFTFIQSITTSVCSAAAGAAPCLRAEECMRMRNGTLDNGGGRWRRREELLNEVIFVFFAHKEYSRCVRLNHCCHMEYVSVSGKISFACRLRKLSDFIKNILICVPKMNEGLTSLEWTNQLNWKTPSPWSLGIHWLWSWHIIIIFFLTVLFGAAFYICI